MSDPAAGNVTWLEDAVAWGLVAVGWVALWTASRQGLFLVPAALALLAYPFLRRRFPFKAHILVYAGLILPIVLLNQLAPQEGVAGNRFHGTFYISFLGVLWGLLRLYETPNPARFPRLVFFGAVACAPVAVGLPELVADSERWKATSLLGPLTPDSPMAFYAGITAAFGLLSLLALRLGLRQRSRSEGRSGPGRWVGVGFGVLCVAGATYGTAYAARHHYQELANIYTRMLTGGGGDGGSGGFSGQGDLSSVSRRRSDEGDTVGLRVWSVTAPGYLRAKAFADYRKGSWQVAWRDGPALTEAGRLQLPERRAPGPDETPQLVVQPAAGATDELFLPLQAAAVDAPGAVRVHWPGESLRSVEWSSTRGYGVFLERGPVRAGGARPEWLALPADERVLKVLDQTLQRLGIDAGTPVGEVVDHLGRHFRDGYTYEVGVKLPRWTDPMVPFLGGELKRGHCELYATAGVLLLRRRGIPARYVTGYVCLEKNPVEDDLWLARHRDAHAWIEFFHPSQGWSLAEFTPGGGVPDGSATGSWLDARLEWLKSVWDRLVAWIMDLPARAQALFEALLARPLALLLLCLLVAGVFVARTLLRRRGDGDTKRSRARRFAPELLAQRTRYLALERTLRDGGLGRRPGETLLEYAARLEAEALPPELPAGETCAFLRAFAAARYAPGAAASA